MKLPTKFQSPPPAALIYNVELYWHVEIWERTIRGPVTRYQRRILYKHEWPVAEQYAAWGRSPVDCPSRSYMLSKEHMAIYLAECKKEQEATITVREAGKNSCILADARQLLREAEARVIRGFGLALGYQLLVDRVDCLSAQARDDVLHCALSWAHPYIRPHKEVYKEMKSVGRTSKAKEWIKATKATRP